MKYIDADKLIAKIENMFDNGYYCTPKNIGKQRGRNNVCRKILSLITSLQQEQPKVDLEKEYESFVTSDPVYSKLMNGIVGKAIARYFYELGLKTRKEE